MFGINDMFPFGYDDDRYQPDYYVPLGGGGNYPREYKTEEEEQLIDYVKGIATNAIKDMNKKREK